MPSHLHSIAIADDHAIIRYGLERLFAHHARLRVVAQFTDGYEVMGADFSRTDVLLLDLNMPGPDYLTIISRVAQRYADLRIIVYTQHAEEWFSARVLAAGATAFLSKDESPDGVLRAVHGVLGLGPVPPENQSTRHGHGKGSGETPLHASLSAREMEIFCLIAGGTKPTEIALRLDLRIGTVTTHIHRVKRKLGVRSLGDLVLYGQRHRLLGE